MKGDFKQNLILTFFCLFVGSCMSVGQFKQNPSNDLRKQDEVLNPLLNGPYGQLPNGNKAWDKFTVNGQYRMASKKDFSFSEKLLSKEFGNPKDFMEKPFTQVDVNGDSASKEYGVFVVDNNIRENNRFGVVIFDETINPKEIPEPYWVLKEKDLSSSIFMFSRDGLSIYSYEDDQLKRLCRIQWEKSNNYYICK